MPRTLVSGCNHIDHHKLAKVRGFPETEPMNEAIVEMHNDVVRPDDIWICHGDVGLGNPARVAKYLERMNGKKILILGNHDTNKNRKKYIHLFDEVHNGYLETQHHIDGNPVLFVHSHYPLATWNGQYRGSIHLHSHCHSRGVNPFHPHKFDVGIDLCTVNADGTKSYKIQPPLTIQQVVDQMKACYGRQYTWLVKHYDDHDEPFINEFKSDLYELKPFIAWLKAKILGPDDRLASVVKIEELTANWDGEL